MINWLVQKRDTGETVYAYSSENLDHLQLFPLEVFNHLKEVDVLKTEVSTKRITRLAFRNRFKPSEKVTLEIAAIDNPSANMTSRQQSAALRSYMSDVNSASFVDLNREDTRSGVMMLETLGLLAQGRAIEILDSPVKENEVYREDL